MPDTFEYLKIKKFSESEQFVRIIHRHWFNIFQKLFVFLVAFLMIGGSYLAGGMLIPQFSDESFIPLIRFIESTMAIIVWMYLFLVWIDYYFDIWIITTDRIINIEQMGLFRRRVSEIPLAKVQSITTEVNGIIPSTLNFGDLHVSSANEEAPFIFRFVPDPNHIRTEIMTLRQKTSPADWRI